MYIGDMKWHTIEFKYRKQDCTFLSRQAKRQFYFKYQRLRDTSKQTSRIHARIYLLEDKLNFIHCHMRRQKVSQDLTQITRLDTKRRGWRKSPYFDIKRYVRITTQGRSLYFDTKKGNNFQIRLHCTIKLPKHEQPNDINPNIWFFQKGEGGLIRHAHHNRCLEGLDNQIVIRQCDEKNKKQIWVFESYPDSNVPADAKRTWM